VEFDLSSIYNEEGLECALRKENTMSKVIVDDSLRSKLNGLNAEVELCDASGRTLGHFVPEDYYKKLLYAWLNAQISDEELERASQETGGRPLAEIWKSLGRT
jgi:hypothetical protein